ncbi:MAG: MBL fold metallo-hydrolase [Bacteroidetes bacterium]|nr:MBL fold metallo-hydrolase [Bacteroidota bacterium]
MFTVKAFMFNPFQENTYVLYDESGECVVIDPGCYETHEEEQLSAYISDNQLVPVRLLNTHCHIDHVFGNKYIAEKYDLPLAINENELVVLHRAEEAAMNYGITYKGSPEPTIFLTEMDVVRFGKTELKISFTPGHSPGSISFYNEAEKVIISGDVLFLQSIGRFDFPGGDEHVLMDSINNKLFLLGDDMVVHPGHGPQTTIGYEKEHNPFVLNYSG